MGLARQIARRATIPYSAKEGTGNGKDADGSQVLEEKVLRGKAEATLKYDDWQENKSENLLIKDCRFDDLGLGVELKEKTSNEAGQYHDNAVINPKNMPSLEFRRDDVGKCNEKEHGCNVQCLNTMPKFGDTVRWWGTDIGVSWPYRTN